MLLPVSLFLVSVQGQKGLKYNRSPSKAEAEKCVYAMTIQYRRLMGVAVDDIKQNVGNQGLCLAAVSFLFLVTSCRKEVAAGDNSPTRPAAEVIAEADT